MYNFGSRFTRILNDAFMVSVINRYVRDDIAKLGGVIVLVIICESFTFCTQSFPAASSKRLNSGPSIVSYNSPANPVTS